MMELLLSAWNWLGTFQAPAITVSLAVLIFIITNFLKPGVKLIWGIESNSFSEIQTDDGTVAIYVENTYVQNVGRAGGSSLEIAFEGKPNSLSFYPTATFDASNNENGEYIVKLDFISPKELISVTSMSINGNKCGFLNTRCKESIGTKVEFWTLRKYGPIYNYTVVGLVLLGVAYFFELLGKIIL